MRYGVPFVDPASDWYSASVPVIIYVIFYNIGAHYKGTRMYLLIICFSIGYVGRRCCQDAPSPTEICCTSSTGTRAEAIKNCAGDSATTGRGGNKTTRYRAERNRDWTSAAWRRSRWVLSDTIYRDVVFLIANIFYKEDLLGIWWWNSCLWW